MTLPDPLTPADSDISDFGFMPLDVVRFRNSDLVAFEPAESILAALMLWGVSWHSTPAGSLTDDDRSLAQAAGYGRAVKEWKLVRDGALRGFVKCSDGRLYHPVVAEKANEAWKAKLRRMWATHCATIRKRNERRDENEKHVTPSFEEWIVERDAATLSRVTNGNVTRDTPDDTSKVTRDTPPENAPRDREGTGTGKGQGQYINTQQALDSAKPPADVATPRVDPFDLTASADKFARLAGIPHTQPGAIAQNVAVIREWNTDGIDLDTILVPIIERFRLDKPDQRVSTLRFFDQSVRAAVAAAEAKRGKAGGYVAKPGKAVDPLKVKDEDEDPVRVARSAFKKIADLAPDKVALSLANDRSTLVITARSQFVAAKVRGDHWNTVTAAASLAGLIDVEVRTQ